MWEVKEKVKIRCKYRFCTSTLEWVCIKNKVFSLVKRTYNVIIEISGTTSNLRRREEKKNDYPQIEKRFNYIDRKFKTPAFLIQRPLDNRDAGGGG